MIGFSLLVRLGFAVKPASEDPPSPPADPKILLSGDAQTGGDRLLLSGDAAPGFIILSFS